MVTQGANSLVSGSAINSTRRSTAAAHCLISNIPVRAARVTMQETPHGAGGTKTPQGSSLMVARSPGKPNGLALARCDQRPRRTEEKKKTCLGFALVISGGLTDPRGARQFPTNQFGELMLRLCWPMEKRGIETHDLGMRRPASRGVSRPRGTFDVAGFLVIYILALSMFCSPQGQTRCLAKL